MPPLLPTQVADPESLSGTETTVIPVLEERVSIATRRRVTGRVRVRLNTVEQAEQVAGDLTRERVSVERVPVGRVVDGVPAIREEGDITIIPVVEERLVVEKRLVLVEEIRLTRHRETHRHRETVTVRRQQAAIDRLPPEGDE